MKEIRGADIRCLKRQRMVESCSGLMYSGCEIKMLIFYPTGRRGGGCFISLIFYLLFVCLLLLLYYNIIQYNAF